MCCLDQFPGRQRVDETPNNLGLEQLHHVDDEQARQPDHVAPLVFQQEFANKWERKQMAATPVAFLLRCEIGNDD